MADKYFGKYTGVVSENRDEENLGRLQVSVPSILEEDDLILAGPALPYGYFFVPEIGVKVWVEFEGGDLGLPLWTGVQYVPGEWAEEGMANPPQKRVVRSPTGNLLLLSDKQGEEGVRLFSTAVLEIRALGTINIRAPNVIINGRVVTPLPNAI